jgi:hypothetical protein
MQNTQHDFRPQGDGIEIQTIIDNLSSLGVTMFAPTSPNINWKMATIGHGHVIYFALY